ncbi:MAG TPA: type II secretion system F family protein [Candidatus Paceibacterota bacterium]
MLFNYKSIDTQGVAREGSIDAINIDVAINSLQRRGLVVSSVAPVDEDKNLLSKQLSFFTRISNKDVVILSRQLATLFEAQVSALRIFRLLMAESSNQKMSNVLKAVADDLQGGSSISKALSRHPKVFSNFYVNMVRSGEESGKLDQIFIYLADHLDRTYEVTSKARNALIYPAFVVVTFIVVIILMFTMVIPNISVILKESGQDIPIYTTAIIAISDILIRYGYILLVMVIVFIFFTLRYIKTPAGAMTADRFKLSVPILGKLFEKLYLSRIADNMNTMLISAIPIVKALEITSEVVGSPVYREVINDVKEKVKTGSPLSESLGKHLEIPGIMSQMVKVGEETGEMGQILKNLAKFYRREVTNAIDTLVGLIEPAMIVFLGAGVGILLAAVLVPIYSISSAL